MFLIPIHKLFLSNILNKYKELLINIFVGKIDWCFPAIKHVCVTRVRKLETRVAFNRYNNLIVIIKS